MSVDVAFDVGNASADITFDLKHELRGYIFFFCELRGYIFVCKEKIVIQITLKF